MHLQKIYWLSKNPSIDYSFSWNNHSHILSWYHNNYYVNRFIFNDIIIRIGLICFWLTWRRNSDQGGAGSVVEGLCQNRIPRHSSLAVRQLKVSYWHVFRCHLGKGNRLLNFITDSNFFMKNKLSNKDLGSNCVKIHEYASPQ